VLLGSAAERELCASIGGGTTIDLSGQTTFAEFAAVIAGADAVVAGNSAGIHVAAAVGTPVVSIFPPTIPPARFRPWRVRAEMLGVHDIACRGCRARSCPIPGQPCIGDVRASDVLDALQRLGVQPAAVPA
jgi:ADP-heptose:LPS heptosyltransferase